MKVLIAEDNQDAADSLAIQLEYYGYDVVTAYDGVHACEVAQTARPDIAILDLRMPRKSGYEVASFIRSLGCLHKGCLIALTGEPPHGAADQAWKADFDHFLTKPVAGDEVVALLAGCTS